MSQEPVNPVVALLLKSPLTPAQRRAASEAFSGATNEDDLQERMVKLNLPKTVRADLWDLKASSVPEPTVEAPAAPEGAAWSRFAKNFGEMINPVSIVTGAYNAIRHPLDTGAAILEQSGEQFDKATQAGREGRYSEMVGHGLGSIPVIGPIAAEAGEQIAAGDIAGGLGKAAGMVVPFGAAEGMARSGVKVIPKRAAAALERGAAERVADVIAPKSSTAMGRRMGNRAQKIAPELLQRGDVGGWTRAGLQNTVEGQLSNATSVLDEVSDARLAARAHETQPVIDALKAKRGNLAAEASDATMAERVPSTRTSSILDETGQPIEVTDYRTEPYGRDVIPGPNQPRAGVIDQAIGELEQLGPTARYDSLKSLRQAYDKAAEVKYNPSVTADYLKVMGKAEGAADVTGSLRSHLAKLDPETAAANLDYSLYKGASDVLKATEEIERARPKVGRQIMARLTGSVVGGQQAGVAGAAAGFALGPVVEQALSAGFTTKLQTAKWMNDMAKAIRKGDVGRATSLSFKVRQLVKQTEASRARGSEALTPSMQEQ